MCGGSVANSGSNAYIKASKTCYRIKPLDKFPKWIVEDSMPIERNSGDFVWLPDGTGLVVNGGRTGIAGFDFLHDAVTEGFYYFPNAPSGSRWVSTGNSTIERLYHSVAVVLPNGTVWISGNM